MARHIQQRLSRQEVVALLSRLHGPVRLMASLMYGSGLRLMECAELRIKDVNFDRGELTVRDGKGGKDRVTMLPSAMKERLLAHLDQVRLQHDADLQAGRGYVALPSALRLKYPGGSTWTPRRGVAGCAVRSISCEGDDDQLRLEREE